MTFTRILTLSTLLFFSASCATVPRHHSSRRGFFDRMGGSGDGGFSGGRDAYDSASTSDDLDDKTLNEVRPLVADWQWPIDSVRVTSKFGRRGFDYHEGIDLKAQRGTPVYAVDDGRVLYADDRIGGYGRMVVLKHRGGLSTVYAHNSRVLVHAGQKVKRGQTVAISGNTGKSSGPHVHFELRVGLRAVDPMSLMPKAVHYTKQNPRTRVRTVASNRFTSNSLNPSANSSHTLAPTLSRSANLATPIHPSGVTDPMVSSIPSNSGDIQSTQ